MQLEEGQDNQNDKTQRSRSPAGPTRARAEQCCPSRSSKWSAKPLHWHVVLYTVHTENLRFYHQIYRQPHLG